MRFGSSITVAFPALACVFFFQPVAVAVSAVNAENVGKFPFSHFGEHGLPFLQHATNQLGEGEGPWGLNLQQLDMANSFLTLLRSFEEYNKNYDSEFLQDYEVNVDDSCAAHLSGWAQNVTSPWSIQMLDAMSKIPEGILSGHTTSLGDYDECLATRGEIELGSQIMSRFKGRYCTVMLLPAAACQIPTPDADGSLASSLVLQARGHARVSEPSDGIPDLGVVFGGTICVPSKCGKDELQGLLAAASNDTGICVALIDCKTDDKPKLTTGDIVMIIILATLAVLCCIGTAVDLAATRRTESKLFQAAIAFSVYTNTKKWLSTSSGGDNLGCVHGIRFLSTCWVVLAHTLSIWRHKVWNLVTMLETYKDWTIYPILNGTIAVDTFFTLAGLLAAYNLLKALDKSRGRLNVPMLYLHRYLRLTPTYAILIGIMATLFQYMKTGPHTSYSQNIEESALACQRYWWHNLLYINNLIEYPNTAVSRAMCHGESWYLGNDMQFFLVSPLLLWPLWKWPVVGAVVMGVFTVASVVVPVVVTYVYELDATLLFITANGNDFHGKSYNKPWMRFGPYIVGLWAGYFLYTVRKRKTLFRLPAWTVIIGWLTSTAMALAIIFGPMRFYDPANGYDRLGSAFYAGMHRFGWGLVISWVILACTLGYGSFINVFLSWKVFIPLGRLSFCVYMISLWLQALYYLSARQHVSYDLYTGINLFFAHMVMSLLLSFVACMVFESPFIALEKILFAGRAKPSPPKAAPPPQQTEEEFRSKSKSNAIVLV